MNIAYRDHLKHHIFRCYSANDAINNIETSKHPVDLRIRKTTFWIGSLFVNVVIKYMKKFTEGGNW